jgi:hypothetical protein
MGRVPSSQPISTEEAKARLREAARRASPSGYVQQHPLQTVGLALVAGLLAGRTRLPNTTAMVLAEQLLPLVIRMSQK